MIRKETLDFLKSLKKNNNREWFQAHKGLYEEAKKDAEDNVNYLIMAISGFDPSLVGLEAKDVMFRIYRDIRFSKDKSPYKNHFGALLSKNGKKGMAGAGYYFQIKPGNSIICGGVFHPDSGMLGNLRDKINGNFKKFTGIMNQPDFKKYFKEVEGEKLKNVPRGFDKESPAAEFLKMKEFIAVTRFSDDEVRSDNFLKEAVKRIKAVKEFNEFLTV